MVYYQLWGKIHLYYDPQRTNGRHYASLFLRAFESGPLESDMDDYMVFGRMWDGMFNYEGGRSRGIVKLEIILNGDGVNKALKKIRRYLTFYDIKNISRDHLEIHF